MKAGKVTVWVTKWCLTAGIREVTVNVGTDVAGEAYMDPDRGLFYPVNGRSYRDYVRGSYVHLTRAKALEHARMLRAAKVQSLARKIANLEKLEFGDG